MKINRMKADERAPEWRDVVADPFFWTTVVLTITIMAIAVATKL